jgi:predicted 3-demethylubiquinone-9 3-methyltransferase (glyoxalase superfamily)
MQLTTPRITPFLWFDTQAEDAANHYVSVFPDSEITSLTRYTEPGRFGHPVGSVFTIGFRLGGLDFVALNGGPYFKFDCAVSFVVSCADQQEVDYYWEKLGESGAPEAQQCGWLADRFGLSWQVVPAIIPEFMTHPNPEVAARTMQAVLGMKKIDIAAIRDAVGDLV